MRVGKGVKLGVSVWEGTECRIHTLFHKTHLLVNRCMQLTVLLINSGKREGILVKEKDKCTARGIFHFRQRWW